MDAITSTVLSIQNPILTSIGLFLDDSFLYVIVLFTLLIITEKRNEKRRKIIISLIIAFVLGSLLKSGVAIERPCVGQPNCPEEYSFPSLHAALAFTLAAGFLDKKQFPYFLLFALFVGFTRLNLGVHTFYDVAGALPVALLSYYFVDILWKKEEGKNGA
jgi:membrane-associated phospholipid phosphatase